MPDPEFTYYIELNEGIDPSFEGNNEQIGAHKTVKETIKTALDSVQTTDD